MRKWNNFKEFCVYVIMGIDIVLIGILLILMEILFMTKTSHTNKVC